MRLAYYEIRHQADGRRLAVYTVEAGRRRFIVTRRLGSAQIRLHRQGWTMSSAAEFARPTPNPYTRRRRGFGAV